MGWVIVGVGARNLGSEISIIFHSKRMMLVTVDWDLDCRWSDISKPVVREIDESQIYCFLDGCASFILHSQFAVSIKYLRIDLESSSDTVPAEFAIAYHHHNGKWQIHVKSEEIKWKSFPSVRSGIFLFSINYPKWEILVIYLPFSQQKRIETPWCLWTALNNILHHRLLPSNVHFCQRQWLPISSSSLFRLFNVCIALAEQSHASYSTKSGSRTMRQQRAIIVISSSSLLSQEEMWPLRTLLILFPPHLVRYLLFLWGDLQLKVL